jgi:cell division protein FtsB
MTGSHSSQNNALRRTQSDYLPTAMRVVLGLIIACALMIAGLTFYPVWNRLADMRRDLARQTARLEELKKTTAERELQVHLLQTDKEYLEMIARDRLDLMKEGETIFRLNNAKPRS